MNPRLFINKAIALLAIPMLLTVAVAHATLPPLTQWGGTLDSPIGLPKAIDVQQLVTGNTNYLGTSVFSGSGIVINSPGIGGLTDGGIWREIDPSTVFLSNASYGQALLVGGDAGFANTIGISLNQDYGLTSGDDQKLFQNIAADNLFFNPTDSASEGSQATPITNGKLDFFLAADDGNGATPVPVYWTDTTIVDPNNDVANMAYNPDGLQHVRAFLHTISDPGGQNTNGDISYILYAFEDISQLGDLDFNDAFMLFGSDGIVLVPEPETYALMGSFLLCAVLLKRRKSAMAAKA